MILNDELLRARKSFPLTQAAMAVAAGVSRMTVQRIETAGIDPRLSTVQEMARVLGLELMLVPRDIRSDLEAFVRSGGRVLGQPVGAGAPPSIVDQIALKADPRK